MNIGEISKPTADRAQIKKKLDVKNSEPIAPSGKVSDLVELSVESRDKYEKDQKERNSSKNNRSADEHEDASANVKYSIDIEV